MDLNLFEIAFRFVGIYSLIASGCILRGFSIDPDNSIAIKFLTKFILVILFPYLVISAILNLTSDSLSTFVLSVLFCLVVIFSGMIAVILYSHFHPISNPMLGSMLLAVSFPNSIFLPFPLILMLIGPQGLLSATIFAVTIIIIQNSVGSYLAIKFGSPDAEHASLDMVRIAKKVFLFPPMLSMIIGFVIKILFHPDSFAGLFSFLPFSTDQINFVSNSINWFSLIFALLLVGLTFNFTISSLKNRFLLSTSDFRLFVGPLSAIIFISLIYILFTPAEILKQEFIIPILIQAFSGPAIVNIAFAKEFSLDIESESVYITIITLLSLLFLPFLVVTSLFLL